MTGQRFVFATCAAGAEAALKAEIAREWPGSRLAYSRPGFVTFKFSEPSNADAGFDLRSVFARAYGISLGKAQGATLEERARYAVGIAAGLGGDLRLEVWERDRPHCDLGDEAQSSLLRPTGLVTRVADALHAEAARTLGGLSESSTGGRAFDVVLVEEDEWWLGWHVTGPAHRPWPGGMPMIELPGDAPSRGYLKVEEALRWSELPIRRDDCLLELGSSPGGASHAWLAHGLNVVGVDPADMDRHVTGHVRFRHVRLQAQQLRAQDLARTDWIASDMNVPPAEALAAVEKFAALSGATLLGALVTLKFRDWDEAAALPSALDRLRAMGFNRVRAAHLFHNRCEVCAVGLMPLGEARCPRESSPSTTF